MLELGEINKKLFDWKYFWPAQYLCKHTTVYSWGSLEQKEIFLGFKSEHFLITYYLFVMEVKKLVMSGRLNNDLF